MRRLLTLAVAACICGQAHADPDDFRCFVSIGHQPPIRLEIEFTNANAGYVTYEHGHGRIPVALTDDKSALSPRDRPGEATMRWREDATVGAGGEYVMTSEGARVADFRYIRNKDGKIFRFEEDLQASGENACTWNK
ncbi:MAG: hypothetical protein KF903_07005 [Dokdonella sp.]|uniref:hypothetical protein n=1 Tax=Dokdonella sp. TaxID=2291710 RepID=UPI0025C30C00|nr:hypothetical protein [Dokdonella sp.]MBX3700736.1 hypothetical protein [Dokdonella sp.]